MRIDYVEENLRARSDESLRGVEHRLAASAAVKAITLVTSEKLRADEAIRLRMGMNNIVRVGRIILEERVDRRERKV